MSMDIRYQTINNQTALDDFLFVHDDLLLGLSCIPPIFWGVSPPKKNPERALLKRTVTMSVTIQKRPKVVGTGNL